MYKVVILGSTGSLGRQVLEVLENYKNEFRVIGISAYKKEKLLKKQSKKHKVPARNTVIVSKESPKNLEKLAAAEDADIVINVLSGISGINSTISALKAGKILILGNKESLVAEGQKIMKLAGKTLIPLDSEHNAIFEILKKFPKKIPEKIILPCSGGPFLGKNKNQLKKITASEAINHPKWEMGEKISIESATLINKGLEIIEAHYLFNLPLKKIDVIIHPECLIHGIVRFKNESYAYISEPDMREHIENALFHAVNKKTPGQKKIKHLNTKKFTLSAPDYKTLPGIKIVIENYKRSPDSMKHFLQKEEQTIQKFLNDKISFIEIFESLQPAS
ncbi:hypothetical protein GF366_03930 [Candidatus Peregrinibacteria bacterium]|nr:hypothetical protein [Candidatus Peregrinibacteria bacterium]